MRLTGTRAIAAVGFAFLVAFSTACGGSTPEPKAPATEAAAGTPVGSITPDPAPDAPLPDPPKSVTASSDNGSDIIPPFSTNKDLTPKKGAAATPAKPTKKGAAKPKKKVVAAKES